MFAATPDRTLAALRARIAAIDARGQSGLSAAAKGGRAPVSLGHPGADAALAGGLARGALHEILPATAGDMAAATGFALGLAACFGAAIRPWFWVRQDMADLEAGVPYGPGLAAFGLDPGRLTLVAGADGVDVLRAAEEALRCRMLAAVVIEPWGDPKSLDLTGSRRLVLAAEAAQVPALLLRSGGKAGRSAAASRWRIAAAPSAPVPASGLGLPTMAAVLERSRTGHTGHWMMEWKADERCFALPDPLAGLPASASRPAASGAPESGAPRRIAG